MPMARDWHGMDILAKKNRALGRATVTIGMMIAADTKRITHRISGTLARSVHAARPGESHDEDESMAAGSDLMASKGLPAPLFTPGEVAVEVGSWLPYACVEWHGRGHPGITEGVEGVRGARSAAVLALAFREEGL